MSYNYFKNGVLNLIAGKHPTDKALSSTSNHPVANRILKAKFDEQQASIDGINTQLSNLPEIKTYNLVDGTASSGVRVIPTTAIPITSTILGVKGSPKYDVFMPYQSSSTWCLAQRAIDTLAFDTTNGINVTIYYIE